MATTQPTQQTGEGEEPKKLTKAEKKKLRKLQKKQAREELLKKLARDELEKEIANARKISKVKGKRWKEMALKYGRPEYKAWMIEHGNLFDHLIDKKDKIIKELKEDLELCERMRQKRFQDYVLTTDNIIKSFHKNINEVVDMLDKEKTDLLKQRISIIPVEEEFQNEFQNEVQNNTRLVSYYTTVLNTSQKIMEHRDYEMNILELHHEYVEDYLKTILHLMFTNNNDNQMFWQSEFTSKKDEERNKNQNTFDETSTILEMKLTDVWKDYLRTMENYENDVTKTLQKSNELQKKVQSDENMISTEFQLMEKLKNIIEKCNTKIRKGEPQRDKLNHLRKERNSLSELLLNEKLFLGDLCKKYNYRLKFLIQASSKAIQYLTKYESKGKTLIKHLDICRRLETAKELAETMNKDVPHHTIITQVEAVNKMARFWRKVGNAEMIKTYLASREIQLKKQKNQITEGLKASIGNGQMEELINMLNNCGKL